MSRDIVLISGLTKTFSSASEKLVIFNKLNFSIEEGKKFRLPENPVRVKVPF